MDNNARMSKAVFRQLFDKKCVTNCLLCGYKNKQELEHLS